MPLPSTARSAAFTMGLIGAIAAGPVLFAPAPVAAQTASEIPAADPVADLAPYREMALEIVRDAAASDTALLRTQALEAVQHAPDLALPLVTLGLSDDDWPVRFSALVTAGKLELRPLRGAFAEAIRKNEPRNGSAHVRAAVIFAAAKCGPVDDRVMSQMAALLNHRDPRVRANAAMLMGELGNDTALQMVRRAIVRPADDMTDGFAWELLKVQVAESIAKLGDVRGLTSLRQAMFSSNDEVRILATQALGRLGDRSVWQNMNNFLVLNPIELRLAAAEGLARMDRDRGGMLGVMAEAATHEKFTVRVQSAFALGPYEKAQARGYLVRLLNDGRPEVRIAAAAAVLEATLEPPQQALR